MARWISTFPEGSSKPALSVASAVTSESSGVGFPWAKSTHLQAAEIVCWLGMSKDEGELWFRRTADALGGTAFFSARRNGDVIDITITATNVPRLQRFALLSPTDEWPAAPPESDSATLKRIERKLLARIEQLEQDLAASKAREAKLAKKLAAAKRMAPKGTKES